MTAHYFRGRKWFTNGDMDLCNCGAPWHGHFFTCANCHERFAKEWTDEEADEYEINFPETQGDETDLVCDNCYKLIMRWAGKTP